ncbi:MAG TPA: hypothetical protein VHX88_19395 [Solirubrobacteraceae bacterium]|jgi:predicted ribosome-associated RNA-binding protein Tma20|nr:hypothetical protein [Solirubrobacteraceae bacterium]
MFHSRPLRIAGLALGCAAIGAAAGIAGSAAAPSSSHHPAAPPLARVFGGRFAGGARPFGAGGFGPAIGLRGPIVHATEVVPNGSGGFETVTIDRGTVKSVSGAQLTISEGSAKALYATPTLTIPTGATVRRNGRTASLSSLRAGDIVVVVQTPGSTSVTAAAPGHHAGPGALAGATITHGTVDSVSGQQLTVATSAGASKSLTIPTGADVRRGGQTASLSSLHKGDEVFVVQTSTATHVIAFAAGSGPRFGAHGMGMGGRPGGPGLAGPRAGGPPPPGPPNGGGWPGFGGGSGSQSSR